MNTTRIAPVALFPLPFHHGLTVLLMTITAMAALSIFSYFLFQPSREIF